MSQFIIQGGRKLSGAITTNSSKNAAVALLTASILNKGVSELLNFPRIQETNRIIEVLSSLGFKFSWPSAHHLKIMPPARIRLDKINRQAAAKTRIILLFIGALIHDFARFNLPQAGGCTLGKRSVNPHFFALEEFGIKSKINRCSYSISRGQLKAVKNLVLYESGDTVTENALLVAAKIPGTTTIKFASANYQVQDLCYFLKGLGVKISGIGTTTLTVTGKKLIKKNLKYYLTEDPIESMFFIAIAATTNSSIVIKRCPIDFLELELLKLQKMGFKFNIIRQYKAKNGHSRLVDLETYPSTLTALEDKIYGRPYPGLNIDNLPFFVPIATQARGRTFIHDWAFENRAIYSTEFNKLGAAVTLNDQHRFYIDGPTPLKPADITAPPALRPGAVLIVGMLAARGTSVLRNIYSIERGYEDLSSRLKKIGAHIEKSE